MLTITMCPVLDSVWGRSDGGASIWDELTEGGQAPDNLSRKDKEAREAEERARRASLGPPARPPTPARGASGGAGALTCPRGAASNSGSSRRLLLQSGGGSETAGSRGQGDAAQGRM